MFFIYLFIYYLLPIQKYQQVQSMFKYYSGVNYTIKSCTVIKKQQNLVRMTHNKMYVTLTSSGVLWHVNRAEVAYALLFVERGHCHGEKFCDSKIVLKACVLFYQTA